MDDPYVCQVDDPAAPPLSGVDCGCEMLWWSACGGGGGIRVDAAARIRVDVPSDGGVGVDVVGVVVGSTVVEVETSVVERVLLFFTWPLPLSAISETNTYNN